MDLGIKLENDVDPILPDITQSMHLIGKLLYLTHSRSDIISCVISRLSLYFSKPTNTHMQAAHRVLRYIKVVPALGLFLKRNSNF